MAPSHQKRPKLTVKVPKIAISAPRVLNASSPILHQDIHAFIATTALSPAIWAQYSEAEKRQLIELFPAAYQSYSYGVNDDNAEGKLECPVSAEFLQSDTYVKAGVARFKRDVEAGCWETRWQAQAREAMRERSESRFDEYLRDKAEECFGTGGEEDVEDPADGEDGRSRRSRSGSGSGSDWERNHVKKMKRKAEARSFVVEKLLRSSEDGMQIEVKWYGYESMTWEARTVLIEDVPDMVAALDSEYVDGEMADVMDRE